VAKGRGGTGAVVGIGPNMKEHAGFWVQCNRLEVLDGFRERWNFRS
jgi:hypothetical protein